LNFYCSLFFFPSFFQQLFKTTNKQTTTKGTAAYKTVELDSYLDCKATQHREVQGHESKLFLSYFDVFEILQGGIDSGYRHVEEVQHRSSSIFFPFFLPPSISFNVLIHIERGYFTSRVRKSMW